MRLDVVRSPLSSQVRWVGGRTQLFVEQKWRRVLQNAQATRFPFSESSFQAKNWVIVTYAQEFQLNRPDIRLALLLILPVYYFLCQSLDPKCEVSLYVYIL